MSDVPTPQSIAAWARQVAGWAEDASMAVDLLEGGYSWHTYRVASPSGSVIVRIAPRGGTVEPHDPRAEARTLTEAATAGLPVAEVLAVDDGRRLGRPAAIHSDLPGRNVRPGDDIEDRTAHRTAFARTLATVHTDMPADPLTIRESYEQTIAEEMGHYRRTAPCAQPGFEIAWRWLAANIPDDERPATRLHGDYRLANLLWSDSGELTGVLDWERSRTGDPMCDIAFTRLFSGWCSIDAEAAEVYTRSSGIEVDEERVAYSTVFERWRSFTSAMRGLAAHVDGRNPDRRLVRIGLAGEAGAWRFVEALEAPEAWEPDDLPQARYRSAIIEQDATLAEADSHARRRSLDAIRSLPTSGHDAVDTNATVDDEAYARCHGAAVDSLRRGSMDRELMRALALRATLRYRYLEDHGWH